MSSIGNTLPTVEKLIQRVKIAERSQQKDIRITIQEARDLTDELAALTGNLGTTISEIHRMISEINKSSNEVDVKFDGGGF